MAIAIAFAPVGVAVPGVIIDGVAPWGVIGVPETKCYSEKKKTLHF